MIFTTFGDAMRVPGSRKSLLKAKADGADVRMVYSPLDALAIARKNPDREVIFFGLGFETTMPSTAMTVIEARRQEVRNFSLFCNHITIIPTIKAILDSPDLHLDGFLGPGHVSMVIGTSIYDFIARHYRKPITIAGFEPLDVLHALWMVLKQIDEGRCEVENQYGRVVPAHGNPNALAAIQEVYELREFFEWRGLGSIDHSGVRLRESYAAFDAERKFAVPNIRIADPKACQCGEVLKGVIKPHQCKVFGTACTPETPLGSLMVSTEGACAAYYNYGRTENRSPPWARSDERRDTRRSAARRQRARCAHQHVAWQRRSGDARADRGRVRLGVRQSHAWRAGGPGAHPSRGPRDGTATAWRSPPTPMWSIRYSSLAATSARSPLRAPSTIWRCAAHGRCSCRAAWCWRKDSTSRSCAAWSPA